MAADDLNVKVRFTVDTSGFKEEVENAIKNIKISKGIPIQTSQEAGAGTPSPAQVKRQESKEERQKQFIDGQELGKQIVAGMSKPGANATSSDWKKYSGLLAEERRSLTIESYKERNLGNSTATISGKKAVIMEEENLANARAKAALAQEKQTAAQKDNIGILGKFGQTNKALNKAFTSILIDLHMIRVLGQHSQVVAASFQMIADSIGFVIDMALLPLLPAVINVSLFFVRLGIWLHNLHGPVRVLISLFTALIIGITAVIAIIATLAKFAEAFKFVWGLFKGVSFATKVVSYFASELSIATSYISFLLPALAALASILGTMALFKVASKHTQEKYGKPLEEKFRRDHPDSIFNTPMPKIDLRPLTAKLLGKDIAYYKGFAEGGPLRAGQAAIVGERGPELLLPSGSGFNVIPNNGLRFLADGTEGGVVSTLTNSLGALKNWLVGGVGEVIGRVFKSSVMGGGVSTGVGSTLGDTERAIMSKGFGNLSEISYSGHKNANVLLAAILAALMNGLGALAGVLEIPGKILDPVWDAAKLAWDLIMAALSKAWDLIVAAWHAAWATLGALWNTLWDTAKRIWDTMWNLAEKAWDIIVAGWHAAWKILSDLWDGLWIKAGKAWDTIMEGVSAAFDTIKITISKIVIKAQDLVDWVITKVPIKVHDMVDFIISKISVVLQTLITWVTDKVPIKLQDLVNWVTGTVPIVVQSLINWVTTAIPMYAQNLVNWVLNKIPIDAQTLVNFVTSKIPITLQNLVTWVTTTIPITLQNLISWVTSVKQFVVNDLISWVSTKTQIYVQSLIDWVKDKINVRSTELWSLERVLDIVKTTSLWTLDKVLETVQSTSLWTLIKNSLNIDSTELWTVNKVMDIVKSTSLWTLEKVVEVVQSSVLWPLDKIVSIVKPGELWNLDKSIKENIMTSELWTRVGDPLSVAITDLISVRHIEPEEYEWPSDYFNWDPLIAKLKDLWAAQKWESILSLPMAMALQWEQAIQFPGPKPITSDDLYTVSPTPKVASDFWSFPLALALKWEDAIKFPEIPDTVTSDELYTISPTDKHSIDFWNLLPTTMGLSDFVTIKSFETMYDTFFNILPIEKPATDLIMPKTSDVLAASLFTITMGYLAAPLLYTILPEGLTASAFYGIVSEKLSASAFFAILPVSIYPDTLYKVEQLVKPVTDFFNLTQITKSITDYVTINGIVKSISDYVTINGVVKSITDYITINGIVKNITDYITIPPIVKTIFDFITISPIARTIFDFITMGVVPKPSTDFFSIINIPKTVHDFFSWNPIQAVGTDAKSLFTWSGVSKAILGVSGVGALITLAYHTLLGGSGSGALITLPAVGQALIGAVGSGAYIVAKTMNLLSTSSNSGDGVINWISKKLWDFTGGDGIILGKQYSLFGASASGLIDNSSSQGIWTSMNSTVSTDFGNKMQSQNTSIAASFGAWLSSKISGTPAPAPAPAPAPTPPPQTIGSGTHTGTYGAPPAGTSGWQLTGYTGETQGTASTGSYLYSPTGSSTKYLYNTTTTQWEQYTGTLQNTSAIPPGYTGPGSIPTSPNNPTIPPPGTGESFDGTMAQWLALTDSARVAIRDSGNIYKIDGQQYRYGSYYTPPANTPAPTTPGAGSNPTPTDYTNLRPSLLTKQFLTGGGAIYNGWYDDLTSDSYWWNGMPHSLHQLSYNETSAFFSSGVPLYEYTVLDGVAQPGGALARLAKGGSVLSGGLSWVGEKGPEILNLPTGAKVAPPDKSFLKSFGVEKPEVVDKSITYDFSGSTFQVTGRTDQELFDNMMRLMERESRRAR